MAKLTTRSAFAFRYWCFRTEKPSLRKSKADHVEKYDPFFKSMDKIKDDENVFLLESVEGGERIGRYSFIGASTPSAP